MVSDNFNTRYIRSLQEKTFEKSKITTETKKLFFSTDNFFIFLGLYDKSFEKSKNTSETKAIFSAASNSSPNLIPN